MAAPERDETQSYSDVPPEHRASRAIDAGRRAGIFVEEGRRFRPDDDITRAATAIYLSRALAGGDNVSDPPTGVWTFMDVAPRNEAFRYVEDLVARGVVSGVGEQYFPTSRVDHAQMAVYFARALAGGEDQVPPVPAGEPQAFKDIPPDHYAYRYLQYVHRQGLMEGSEDGAFRPEPLVTRGEFAVLLARAFRLEA